MSERCKVQFLTEAQNSDFRTYLYFVATEDPEINVVRVARRVAEGGHDVPKDKILSRFDRSVKLASDAVRHTNRAYFFDTSGDALYWSRKSPMESVWNCALSADSQLVQNLRLGQVLSPPRYQAHRKSVFAI